MAILHIVLNMAHLMVDNFQVVGIVALGAHLDPEVLLKTFKKDLILQSGNMSVQV